MSKKMSLKIIFFCAQICFIKTALAQCFGPKPGFMPNGLGVRDAPCGRFDSALLLEKYPMPTPGLSIATDDLIIEGIVSVAGSLPFLGTVAIEGVLPTEGQGTVLYGCGNGEVAIMGENGSPYGPIVNGPLAGPIAPGPIGPAFGPRSPSLGPVIEPGMSVAANGAAIAASANSAAQAAAMKSIGFRGANAAGLPAMTRF